VGKTAKVSITFRMREITCDLLVASLRLTVKAAITETALARKRHFHTTEEVLELKMDDRVVLKLPS